MEKNSFETYVREILSAADVEINGHRSWDIQVKNNMFYKRLFAGGSLALGESYMDGWWECEALDRFFDRILTFRVDRQVRKTVKLLWYRFRAALSCSPGRFRAFDIGKHHYDIGNELFTLMLDKWMNYSCAYWKKAGDLGEAQKAKMELICRKLGLKPGMTVLDIGCGWGGLAEYMARFYHTRVTGITVSQEQVKIARRRCKGLPVEIVLTDYRDLKTRFDRIVSVGMFEHVGASHYRTFMRVVRRCLKPRALFLLHTIARNHSVRSCDPWISRYIFPNSMLPSSRQISAASENLLTLEDWHSFGPDYDPTLMAWHKNFTDNWDHIQPRYDERFFRMWTYYLLACAGSFRARRNQLWQIVFSKDGLRPKYESIR